jgi:DNA-binding phage protein
MVDHACESCPFFLVDPLERDGMEAKRHALRVKLERARVINSQQHLLDHYEARIKDTSTIIDGIDAYIDGLPEHEREAIREAIGSGWPTSAAGRRPPDTSTCASSWRPAMTTDAAVAALQRNRADTSAAKQRAVLTALDHLAAQGGEMNISTVARAAGVSRQFVYTHDSLREAVARAAGAVRDGQSGGSDG